MVLIQNQCFGMSGKVFVVTPAKARALLFLVVRLGLGFLWRQVSGSDFTHKFKSHARIFKLGSRRLGKARILPFATPEVVIKFLYPMITDLPSPDIFREYSRS